MDGGMGGGGMGGGGMGGGGSSAPTNQDQVMGNSNKISRGGQSVSISSAGDSSYTVWFAPSGTTSFMAGGNMTSTGGNSMNIDAPNNEGTYYIYVRNSSGQTSNQSSAYLQVDNTAPETQNDVLSSNQTVRSMTTVTIGSSGDFNNQVWLAGSGTQSFLEGDMMTKASSGTSTSILSPNAEGTYYAYVIDQAGNVSNPSSSTLTVDNTAPTNQNTVFPNSVSKKSGVTVQINSSGDASNEVWFAPNGTTSFSETNSNMSKANNGDSIEINAPTDEGSYNLYIIDPAGNRSDGSMAILTVDNTAPTNQDTVFPNSASSFAGGNVSINSSGDQTNEVWFAPAGTSIFLEGPNMTKAMNGISTTINAPTNDQNYYLYIIDQAGNVSNPSIAVLTIDNNPPDAPSVVFPVGDTTTNTISVTLASDATSYEYSISDAANGTVGAYTLGTGTSFTLSDRTYAIDDVKVRNKDAAGNISQSTNNTSQFTVDTTPPDPPIVSFPSGTTNTNTVDVTLATGASGFQFSTNGGTNFSVGTLTVNAMGGVSNTGTFTLIDGTYAIDQIQVKNTDAAGNVSTTTNNSSQIIIDTVIPGPPTVTFPSAGIGNVTNVFVTLSSGATNYKYSIDSGVSFTLGTLAATDQGFTLGNGIYNIDQIQVKNGDDAGNESTTINNSYQIIINTTAPDPPTVSFPSGTTNTNSVSVTLATNAVSYEFSIDSGVNFSSGTGTSFTLSDATYSINQIQVKNIDAAGNISGTTNNDNQIVIDTVAPDPPTVSFPSGNTNNNVITVTLATGATSYEFSIDSGINFSAGSGTSFTLSDGTYVTHQIQVKNSDAAGNTSSETKNVLPIVLNTVPPSAPTVTFPNGTTSNNIVNVTLATSAVSYEFSIDSGASFTNGTGTSFTLNDATYTINQVQVKNTDSFGNSSSNTTNSNIFTIDTNVPDGPTVVFPIGVTNNNSLTIILSDTAVSWEYSINSGVSFIVGTGGTFILSNGTYIVNKVQIRNRDSAGNASAVTSNGSQFIVNTTLSDTTTTSDSTATTPIESCINQRKQRSQFFFHEAGSNVRFEDVSPYIKDQNGNLIYTPEQLDMRRKAEILKYKTPNTGNIQKNKYSQLSRSTKRNNTACANTNLLIPTSSSNVPGKVMNLTENPNVPLYKYYSQQEQFRFQNIAYDNFKRIFDIFPINNIIIDVENNEPAGDIILLNPNTSQLTFDFTFPICINYNANYTVPSSTTYTEDNSAITAFNISIFSAELQIFYSDTLIQTKILPFSSIIPNDTDLSKTTFTCSTVFDEPGSVSTNGPVNLQTYMGTLQFKNITLASVTQYVYTLKLNVKLNYSEFDSQPGAAARSNVDGNNISSIGERNLTNVSYSSIVNIENSSVAAFNTSTNCNFELFNNPPEGENATNLVEITNPTFVPFSISTV